MYLIGGAQHVVILVAGKGTRCLPYGGLAAERYVHDVGDADPPVLRQVGGPEGQLVDALGAAGDDAEPFAGVQVREVHGQLVDEVRVGGHVVAAQVLGPVSGERDSLHAQNPPIVSELFLLRRNNTPAPAKQGA